jgi:hypothetical protein
MTVRVEPGNDGEVEPGNDGAGGPGYLRSSLVVNLFVLVYPCDALMTPHQYVIVIILKLSGYYCAHYSFY